MILPNLIIVGAQKCGTTWLFNALRLSSYVSCSRVKELNFFNQRPPLDLKLYSSCFDKSVVDARYILESTPHYFRLPYGSLDISRNIYNCLGDIPLIVMIRNPIQRYLSAYTHHIIEGRLPYKEVITDISNRFAMVELGKYAAIHNHFSSLFSKIYVFDYQDLVNCPESFGVKVFDSLNLAIDFDQSRFNFRTNDTKVRAARKSLQKLPVLDSEVRARLADEYEGDIRQLECIIGKRLDSWLE